MDGWKGEGKVAMLSFVRRADLTTSWSGRELQVGLPFGLWFSRLV